MRECGSVHAINQQDHSLARHEQHSPGPTGHSNTMFQSSQEGLTLACAAQAAQSSLRWCLQPIDATQDLQNWGWLRIGQHSSPWGGPAPRSPALGHARALHACMTWVITFVHCQRSLQTGALRGSAPCIMLGKRMQQAMLRTAGS